MEAVVTIVDTDGALPMSMSMIVDTQIDVDDRRYRWCIADVDVDTLALGRRLLIRLGVQAAGPSLPAAHAPM